MLTLTFLGVGSAFAKRNFPSNALLEAWSASPDRQAAPDDTLLVDFGATGPLALHHLKSKPGFSYLDHNGLIYYPAIRRLAITHLHSDHIGGLEELAHLNKHYYLDAKTGQGYRPQLISSPDILGTLWDHSLQGGLEALRGRRAEMEDYFDVLAVHPRGRGTPDQFSLLDRYAFAMLPTDHIRMRKKYDWPSLGLLITDGQSGENVFFSGDTRFDPDNHRDLMSAATLNFHEVQLADTPQPVHTLLSELRTLPESIRKKMILYHYDDTWDHGPYDFVATEFAGFAQPQHRYVLFED